MEKKTNPAPSLQITNKYGKAKINISKVVCLDSWCNRHGTNMDSH